MSQYQPNVASGRSFISKINLKFSGLSISPASFSEKDGPTAESTLIHNAFVSYFDAHNEAYPDWLGATPDQKKKSQIQNQSQGQLYQSRPSSSSSQYQPIRSGYNSVHLSPATQHEQSESSDRPVLGGYSRRGSSRLQELYNKSRQSVGSASGSGYTPSSSGQGSSASHTNRSNSLSNRLRDRLMNGPVDGSGSRATWGRN